MEDLTENVIEVEEIKPKIKEKIINKKIPIII